MPSVDENLLVYDNSEDGTILFSSISHIKFGNCCRLFAVLQDSLFNSQCLSILTVQVN